MLVQNTKATDKESKFSWNRTQTEHIDIGSEQLTAKKNNVLCK